MLKSAVPIVANLAQGHVKQALMAVLELLNTIAWYCVPATLRKYCTFFLQRAQLNRCRRLSSIWTTHAVLSALIEMGHF